jgi:hypothetical protein
MGQANSVSVRHVSHKAGKSDVKIVGSHAGEAWLEAAASDSTVAVDGGLVEFEPEPGCRRHHELAVL